mgnify:CR=1 FL=1
MYSLRASLTVSFFVLPLPIFKAFSNNLSSIDKFDGMCKTSHNEYGLSIFLVLERQGVAPATESATPQQGSRL